MPAPRSNQCSRRRQGDAGATARWRFRCIIPRMGDRDVPIMAAPEDWMRRFHLEHAGVRGVIVRLGAAWREIAGRAGYPPAVRTLLGRGDRRDQCCRR